MKGAARATNDASPMPTAMRQTSSVQKPASVMSHHSEGHLFFMMRLSAVNGEPADLDTVAAGLRS